MSAVFGRTVAASQGRLRSASQRLRLAAALLAVIGLFMVGLPGQAEPVPPAASGDMLPPVTRVVRASHPYPSCTLASTNHRGWREAEGYVNTPQTIRVSWEVEPGGEAILLARGEWSADQPWRELRHWTGAKKEHGEAELPCPDPTAVKLRVRAPAWPHSGIAQIRVQYTRYTLAALHASGRDDQPSVVLAKGYDPGNAMDWNDPEWEKDLGLGRLLLQTRQDNPLNARPNIWIVDWGWGAAALEQQSQDFTEIARQIRNCNSERRCTVAVGVSMGAITLQYALAAAADRYEDLGVCKYVSINGPHRGVWVNPELVKLLRKAGAQRLGSALGTDSGADEGSGTAAKKSGGCGQFDPAVEELVMAGLRHDAFFSALRRMADGGYDPNIPRVAFTSGALETHPGDENVSTPSKNPKLLKLRIRPLGLPVWLTVKSVSRDASYGRYPGELLPEEMRLSFEDHVRLLSVFRFDYRVQWTAVPTMVPTFSALDFPPDVAQTPNGLRYTRWDQSRFPTIYVSSSGNRSHMALGDWVNPRTGQQLAAGGDSVVKEIEQTLASGS